MKTQLTTHTDLKQVHTMYSLLAVVGIITAIICALVLLREIKPSQEASAQFDVSKKSKSAISQSVTEIASLSVRSVLSLLK
jgi:hypothetical protein